MAERVDLIILGASARAAAFSALRAGLRPWCIDLFADADLRAICPAFRLNGSYPDGFADMLEKAPQAPWLYTGGLENHPRLVARMARIRPLWGDDATALTAVRDPSNIYRLFRDSGLPVPAYCLHQSQAFSATRWLLKPRRGAGGTGIRFYSGAENESLLRRCYLQEFVEGEARAALFVADERGTRLLGVTRQLVGEIWLHAAPFHYCGSVGPLPLEPSELIQLERIGAVLASGCELRGLFGVDGIWREGTFWPVEVNPRYTASVEVLEYATGLKALSWHRQAFTTDAHLSLEPLQNKGIVGKAILFARESLTFPLLKLRTTSLVCGDKRYSASFSIPVYADLPNRGEQIELRKPIMTLFAWSNDTESCLDRLKESAKKLDEFLYCEV